MERILMAEINANMAGTISQILVKEGESVSAGQDVLIMESMKMQIPIQSPDNGTVSQLKVSPGEYVKTGQTLIIIE